MTETVHGLLALTLVVLVGMASLTGGTTLSMLSDTEQATAAINVELDVVNHDSWSVEVGNTNTGGWVKSGNMESGENRNTGGNNENRSPRGDRISGDKTAKDKTGQQNGRADGAQPHGSTNSDGAAVVNQPTVGAGNTNQPQNQRMTLMTKRVGNRQARVREGKVVA